MPGPEPSLTKEQQEQVRILVSNEYTNAAIAEATGIPEGTVQKFAAEARKKSKEASEVQRTVFKPQRTTDGLIALINQIPGIGESKSGFIEFAVRDNPVILQAPHELFRLLTSSAIGVNEMIADIAVKRFFSDLFTQNGGVAGQPYYPGGAQGSGYGPFYPSMQQAQPNYGGFSPQMQTIQSPAGPILVPLPLQQQPLTAQDVLRMIEAQKQEDHIEERTPILKPDGSPLIGPDNQVVYRTIRKPAGVASSEDSMMKYLTLFNAMGLLNKPGVVASAPGGLDEMSKTLAFFQAMGVVKDPNQVSDVDKIVTAMQGMMRRPEVEPGAVELAKIQVQMEAMQNMNKMQIEHLQAMSAQGLLVAKAGAGLPVADQITLKVVDGVEKAIEKAGGNFEKRVDRVERVAAPLVAKMMSGEGGMVGSTPPAGIAMPFSEADLRTMAAKAPPDQSPAQT